VTRQPLDSATPPQVDHPDGGSRVRWFLMGGLTVRGGDRSSAWSRGVAHVCHLTHLRQMSQVETPYHLGRTCGKFRTCATGMWRKCAR
jgi:hypothetical protein